jgi:hypothetical protein
MFLGAFLARFPNAFRSPLFGLFLKGFSVYEPHVVGCLNVDFINPFVELLLSRKARLRLHEEVLYESSC